MAEAPNPFATPTKLSNVTLIVDGKKLHVNKEYLAMHSPVFAAMFFGNFAENGKEEIEIKDVAYEEFSDLLKLIYPGVSNITSDSVPHILKHADRFQVKEARDQAEIFLLSAEDIDEYEKIRMAENYNLSKVIVNGDTDPFTAPSEFSNVVLIIEG
ncbi:hypothetical protein PMAYCL1PPCAC_25990 [Pristionchus mayeri]|uniref:BTB domain-containing protein n=1 Tax=Pristionchus mayeri TaxID=1317129 RepID=A0AAN5D494_9BILA|nr:hypothetical protein PMAYCL1PPCAC_25990 [Pristionchus mayeri]